MKNLFNNSLSTSSKIIVSDLLKKNFILYNLFCIFQVSLIEIYNETIQDLLTKEAKTLDLKTAGNKVNIPGLTEVDIKALDDIKKVMAMGDKNRTTASTKMNSTRYYI